MDDDALDVGGRLPTRADVAEFLKLRPLLKSAINEVKEFSKKKPDGVMSSLKVRLLNRLLEQLKSAMAAGPATEYLDLLDEESLPDYSDAVLILSQYDAAMGSFSGRFHGSDLETGRYDTRWFTVEDPPVTEEDVDDESD
jgi:hypothetical protein